MINQTELKELLHYDPATGIFTWLVVTNKNQVKVGSIAGTLRPDGYSYIRIKGRGYRAHRLAWLYAKGQWPEADIDHRNHIRDANWIDNLRDVTRMQNLCNKSTNTSGVPGVAWHKLGKKWCAEIRVIGKKKHLGLFANIEDATEARRVAELKYYQTTHAEYLARKQLYCYVSKDGEPAKRMLRTEAQELQAELGDTVEWKHPSMNIYAGVSLGFSVKGTYTYRTIKAQTEQETVANFLLQSKQNFERNFGSNAHTDWIYKDIEELLDTLQAQPEQSTEIVELKAKLAEVVKSKDPLIVWSVSSKAGCTLFKTLEDAQHYVSQFPASIGGSLHIRDTAVFGNIAKD
jgi:hypothetical protein